MYRGGNISVHRNSAWGLSHESATRLLHDLSELRIPHASDALSPTPGGPQRNELRVSIVEMRAGMGLHSGMDLPRRPGNAGYRHTATGNDRPSAATGQCDAGATASADVSATSSDPTAADAVGGSHRRSCATTVSAGPARVELGTDHSTSACPATGPQRLRLVTRGSPGRIRTARLNKANARLDSCYLQQFSSVNPDPILLEDSRDDAFSTAAGADCSDCPAGDTP